MTREQKQILTQSRKANVMDGLQYLAEINREVSRLKNKEITEQELIEFLLKRSDDFGYIANMKTIVRLMEEVNQIQA